MIVKVQRALSSTDGVDRVLVYNEDRSYYVEFDDPDSIDVFAFAMSGRKKCFLDVTVTKKTIKINNTARDPGW